MIPKEIKKEAEKLVVVWDNGEKQSIRISNLRFHCPCAICNKNKEIKGAGYIPLYKNEEISIVSIQTVGNYALGITWKDGHNTGIYDFEYLKKLKG